MFRKRVNPFPSGHNKHSIELYPMAAIWALWALYAKGPAGKRGSHSLGSYNLSWSSGGGRAMDTQREQGGILYTQVTLLDDDDGRRTRREIPN